MFEILKKQYLLLIFFPILVNALFNFFKASRNINFETVNFYDLVSLLLLFLFFCTVGISVKKSLNLHSTAFSIVVFLFSFFIFDVSTLFVYKLLSFKQIFMIVNYIWLLIFIYKKRYLETFLITVFYYSLNLFNKININQLTKNQNIKGDVEAVFFSQTQNIYEQSYYFSVTNFTFEGYPQFTSYIQALFSLFSVNLNEFIYLSISTKVVFLLSVLFFLELKTTRINRIFIILIFTSLIVNSDWLQFLFTSSLMSEGIVSLFGAIVFYEIFNSKQNMRIIFVVFGMLYFTKQFLSLIVIIFLIVILFNENYKKFVLFGFFGMALKEFLYIFVFKEINSSHHLSQIDIPLTLKELATLKNLEFSNIFLIGKNIFVDKPLTMLLVGIIILYISYKFSNKVVPAQINIYISVILFNIFCILTLYISAWKNMELESPIRFIWSFLHLKLTLICLLFDNDKVNAKTSS